jgi:hypothetical protein
MTGDATHLCNYRKVSSPWTITIADGSTRKVVGVGDARIETKLGAALHDVLHVPGLEFNLASVMKMDEKGACVVVQGGRCHVRLHGRVVLEASMHDGLYKIRTFSARPPTAMAAKTRARAAVWHERPGHAPLQAMKGMIKGQLVDGFDIGEKGITRLEEATCGSCTRAKCDSDALLYTVSV